MLLTLIVACEIGFWLLLLAGLFTRYLLRRRGLSALLLACVPLIDLVLLAATVVDLRRGATADFVHGLAAAYIGVSVAFGPSLVRWADERFAHRFADGPAPWRPPRGGRARARYEWREFGKAAIAWAIACALLLAAIVLVDDGARTAALEEWLKRLTVILGIWSLWPITHTLWPSRASG